MAEGKVLPIVAYGDPVLRQVAAPVPPAWPELDQLLADMWATMYAADGVGLAAPQVGHSLRLFVVDTSPMAARSNGKNGKEDGEPALKRAFINAQRLHENGTPWAYEEGCLSIPGVREDVTRPPELTLKYQDEHGTEHQETFTGMAARVIQHEYDHIEGKLFLDYATPLRKQLLRPRLQRITRGQVEVTYAMRFPGQRSMARP